MTWPGAVDDAARRCGRAAADGDRAVLGGWTGRPNRTGGRFRGGDGWPAGGLAARRRRRVVTCAPGARTGRGTRPRERSCAAGSTRRPAGMPDVPLQCRGLHIADASVVALGGPDLHIRRYVLLEHARRPAGRTAPGIAPGPTPRRPRAGPERPLGRPRPVRAGYVLLEHARRAEDPREAAPARRGHPGPARPPGAGPAAARRGHPGPARPPGAGPAAARRGPPAPAVARPGAAPTGRCSCGGPGTRGCPST
jgi:hypothetical protein